MTADFEFDIDRDGVEALSTPPDFNASLQKNTNVWIRKEQHQIVTADSSTGWDAYAVFDLGQDIAQIWVRVETVAVDADTETWGITYRTPPYDIFVDQDLYASDDVSVSGWGIIPPPFGPFIHAADGSSPFAGSNPILLPVTLGDYSVWPGLSARFFGFRVAVQQRAGSDIVYPGPNNPSISMNVSVRYI
jgi:hypothetical protein